MSSLLIVGAKGFAKELLQAVLQRDKNRAVSFFDDVSPDLGELVFGTYPLIRSLTKVKEYFQTSGNEFSIGIAAPELRQKFFKAFIEIGGRPESIISPFAKIGPYENSIGDGSCILTDAVVEASNSIGVGSLIHVGAFISHDVVMGDFCEISPRANLLGGVKIGNKCRIGTAATILPGVQLGDNVVVGAGAVVTKDHPDFSKLIGIPSRNVNEK